MRDESLAEIKHTANLLAIIIVMRSPQWKENKMRDESLAEIKHTANLQTIKN